MSKKISTPVAEKNNDLLEIYKRTYSNETFLQFDNKDSDNRIMIFSTSENIKITLNSNCWLSDGTFYTAPKGFTQLYIIHCVHFKNVIPTIYIFMANKTKKSYTIIAEWLQENIPITPKTWIADFEETAITVFQKIYNKTVFNGCHFHFNQIIIRFLIQNKLIDLYKNCLKYRTFVKKLLALSYFPTTDVNDVFNKLKENTDKSYSKVYNFFLKNFINNSKNKNTKTLAYWSIYSRILHGLPTTTNSCEAYHRHLNSTIKTKNSDLGTIINMLKKEESRLKGKLINLYAGKYVNKNFKNNEELKNIVMNYEEYSRDEYMKQVLNHRKIFIKKISY